MARKDGAGAWVLAAYLLAMGAAVGAGWLVREHNAVVIIAVADLAATLVVFGFSRALDNSSLYDPYWSVVPPIIGGYLLWDAGEGGLAMRQTAVMLVVGIWAVRLTYNWWRRWRGLKDEDWRYVDYRAKAGRAYWLVSFAGFHFFPTVMVFLGCLGLVPALTEGGNTEPNAIDGLALAVGIGAVWLETTADRQLHEFSRNKQPGKTLRSGVWGWCRHPNYLGEIGVWVSIALFGAAVDPNALWIWAGPISMVLLFRFISIPLKETRMLARRPDYERLQRQLPMLLPLGRRR